MVDMIPASARLLRYDGRLFPTKRVVAPDSNLFVPVLTLSVSMLLPPLQGTSTGAARSMPGLRAAERRALLAPDRRSFRYTSKNVFKFSGTSGGFVCLPISVVSPRDFQQVNFGGCARGIASLSLSAMSAASEIDPRR